MREGISVHDAIQSILVATEEPLESVEVPLAAALGHALAGSVASERLLPPSDNSAMDGYAVRVGDLVGATPATPVDLQLVDEIAAGGLGSIALKEGQAARIFTGAPVPESADTVVRQEDTENLGDVVRIGLHPQPGAHIRRAGEDIRPGCWLRSVGLECGSTEGRGLPFYPGAMNWCPSMGIYRAGELSPRIPIR